MSLFTVSTDSTSDLKHAYVASRDIWFAPLTFTLEKNGTIEEGLDNFTEETEYVEFYNKVEDGFIPRTAKLNYNAHVEHFTKMAELGVSDVLHFMISSGLANTIEVTRQAAMDVKTKYPKFNVYAVDPLTATVGQGLLVSLAADCRDKGMTAEETYDYLIGLRQHIQHCIIPNDLFYLKKGGRVSAATATVGTILNIKPMLTFDTEGKLKAVGKCRGMKKAFSTVIECMKIAPPDERGIVFVVHTNNYEGAKELTTLIQNKFQLKPKIEIMGPIIGSHVGPGSVSCCWLSVKTREELFGQTLLK